MLSPIHRFRRRPVKIWFLCLLCRVCVHHRPPSLKKRRFLSRGGTVESHLSVLYSTVTGNCTCTTRFSEDGFYEKSKTKSLTPKLSKTQNLNDRRPNPDDPRSTNDEQKAIPFDAICIICRIWHKMYRLAYTNSSGHAESRASKAWPDCFWPKAKHLRPGLRSVVCFTCRGQSVQFVE